MTQAYTRAGKRVPVTVVKAGPVVVTQIKTQEKDGYEAVQIGFGQKKIKNITKPLLGHLRGVAKEKVAPHFLREISFSKELMVGDLITVEQVLSPGDKVLVTGVSKGKGFAGVVKRWHFAGGPKTHGQSDRQRAPGSIGQTTTPGRVFKGKKMAGRMGGKKVSVKNLTVLAVNPQTSEVLIQGVVPGNKRGLLAIQKTGKAEKFVGLAAPGEEIHPEAKQVQVFKAEETPAPSAEGEAPPGAEPQEITKEAKPAQESEGGE